MSSQKGNASRTRSQKHKNRSAFKNNLHDTNHRTKLINSIQVSDVCVRCKEIIEWKIKYKKYKPLTQPKTCVKCDLKTVKKAYHVMCGECGRKYGVCTKCCQSKEVIVKSEPPKTQMELDQELKAILQTLPERRRRTFLRYLDKKQKEKDVEETVNLTKEQDRNDLLDKLKSLKLKDGEGEEDFYNDLTDSDDEDKDSDISE